MAEAVRVLGIDPSLTATGFALIETDGSKCRALAHGAIRTTPRSERAVRLLAIHDEILTLVRTWSPQAVAVESPFVAENVRSAMAIGEVRAVVLLAGAVLDVDVFEYPPAEVKQAVAGYGRSEKDQVMEMVLRQVDVVEPFRSSDAADAAAVALCHIFSSWRSQMIAAAEKETQR
jgi:crossover junction endodeoxyribonuclease RuvC